MWSLLSRYAVAGMMTALVLAVGACSSGGPSNSVASVGGAPGGKSTQQAAAGQADPLKYAQCMRSNGVSNFPDPKEGSSLSLPNGVDPNSSQFKAAENACKQYLPAGPPGAGGQPGNDPWPASMKLKYAQCMRANGLPDFPDPGKGGGFTLQKGSNIDPQSQVFQQATKACSKYQPQGVKPNSNPGGA